MSAPTDAREQARHKASVMIAFAEGKAIRSRFKTHPHPPWIDDLNPRWDFLAVEYEVKPEERKPRVWVIRPHGMGAGIVVESGPAIGESVLVREVLPETETE